MNSGLPPVRWREHGGELRPAAAPAGKRASR